MSSSVAKEKPESAISEYSKPLLAVVGAGDLVVEQARELPALLAAETKRLQELLAALQDEAKTLPKTLPNRIAELQDEAKALPKALPDRIASLQEDYKELPERVRSYAMELGGQLSDKAMEIYEALAVRGGGVIDAIRKQPSTEAARSEAKAAVRTARAAGTAAKRAGKAAEKAAEEAATKIG